MQRGSWTLFSLLTLCASLVGCGSDAQCAIDTDCNLGQRCTENQCVMIGEPVDASVDVGPPVDSGDEDTGGPADAGTDTGPTVMGVGSVTATSELVAGAPSHSVVAFFSVTDPEATDPCTTTLVGGCSLRTCADTTPPPMDAGVDSGVEGPPDAGTDAAPVDAGPGEVLPNAGTIQVTGGTVAITLTADATGRYSPASGASQLWTSSDATLMFRSTAGADVPMFGVALTGTSQPVITLPSASLSRSMDLALSWPVDGVGEGEMVASFFRADMGTGSTTLTCRTAVGGGSLTVPAAALMSFDSANSVTFTAHVVNESVEDLDGWTVTVGNRSAALGADGSRAAINVTIAD